MHFGGVYHFQNWIQCDRVREGRARPHGCRLASVAQLERSTWQVLKSTALDAVNDHGSLLSYIGVGIRAFFSAQGPGLSSKCSKEVLDRQLVSAVLRSSCSEMSKHIKPWRPLLSCSGNPVPALLECHPTI